MPNLRSCSSCASFAVAAVAVLAAGCILHTDGASPEDWLLSPPATPSIDAHFDRFFGGIPCTPASAAGIAGWRATIDDGAGRDSGFVPCWDPAQGTPWVVRFSDLRGGTLYGLTATGYVLDSTTGRPDLACYTAHCSARTMYGPHAVLPSCSVTRSC